MADKPSLYVVEKKEVVILVTLFIVITVLSFTLGVKYGETIGRREKKIEVEASSTEKLAGTGGTLKEDSPGHESGGAEVKPVGSEHGDKTAPNAEHGEEAKAHTAPSHGAEVKAVHGSEHGEETAKASGHGEGAGVSSHEDHGARVEKTETQKMEAKPAVRKEKMDVNSDEYLIEALKENQIESMGAKAENRDLPQETKKVKSGTYVIQVGSHPTKNEADSQLKSLRAKKVEASILPPFKDGQGEWYRVVIQGFKVKRDAEKEAKAYKNKGVILSYYVWKLP